MIQNDLTPTYSLPSANRQVLLARRPAGIPGIADFAIAQDSVPEIQQDQFLVRNLFLSVDPAQRGWASDMTNYSAVVPIGTVMRALAVGVVVDSRDPGFPTGSFVYGWFGWQHYAAASAADVLTAFSKPKLSLSTYAGLLGINGLTAHIALGKYGRLGSGDTAVVSTAAGAVGSLAGQLAKRAGARTIGLSSSASKRSKLIDRFGYDVALDYRAENLAASLRGAAPNGTDLYFDNVGGTILDTVLRQMTVGGRVIQCGTASIDRWSPPPIGWRNEREVLTRRLSWQGFVIFDHKGEFPRAMASLEGAALAGNLQYDEQCLDSLEEAPGALELLYAGRNQGKLLIWAG